MKLTYGSKKEQENIERALTKISPEIAEIFAGRATITMGGERHWFVRQIDHGSLLPPEYNLLMDTKEIEIALRLLPYEEPQHD